MYISMIPEEGNLCLLQNDISYPKVIEGRCPPLVSRPVLAISLAAVFSLLIACSCFSAYCYYSRRNSTSTESTQVKMAKDPPGPVPPTKRQQLAAKRQQKGHKKCYYRFFSPARPLRQKDGLEGPEVEIISPQTINSVEHASLARPQSPVQPQALRNDYDAATTIHVSPDQLSPKKLFTR
eukprot:g192.t1